MIDLHGQIGKVEETSKYVRYFYIYIDTLRYIFLDRAEIEVAIDFELQELKKIMMEDLYEGSK